MRIINIEAGVFESMLDRFEAFAGKVDALCGQSKIKNLGDWLDNQEVCEILDISKRTLQTYRDNGTLPYTRIGHKMYYKADDIKRIIPLVADRKKEKIIMKGVNNGQQRIDYTEQRADRLVFQIARPDAGRYRGSGAEL